MANRAKQRAERRLAYEWMERQEAREKERERQIRLLAERDCARSGVPLSLSGLTDGGPGPVTPPLQHVTFTFRRGLRDYRLAGATVTCKYRGSSRPVKVTYRENPCSERANPPKEPPKPPTRETIEKHAYAVGGLARDRRGNLRSTL